MPIDILQPALFVEPWGIGMRKDETALIKKVNEVLAGMEKSGEAAKIFDKYLGAGTKYNLHRTFKIEPIEGLTPDRRSPCRTSTFPYCCGTTPRRCCCTASS